MPAGTSRAERLAVCARDFERLDAESAGASHYRSARKAIRAWLRAMSA